jgi:hypothetical protein
MLTVILVDLDRDCLTADEQSRKKSDVTGPDYWFNQAYSQLCEDVEIWSSQTGVKMLLNTELVLDAQTSKPDQGVFRYGTRVTAEFETEQDFAFYKLNLGHIKPSNRLMYDHKTGQYRFSWEHG